MPLGAAVGRENIFVLLMEPIRQKVTILYARNNDFQLNA